MARARWTGGAQASAQGVWPAPHFKSAVWRSKSKWTSLRPALFVAFWLNLVHRRHRERRTGRVVTKTVRRSLSLRKRADQMSDAYFCVFWAEKNAERKAQGAEALNFREARRVFGCHAPPPGAVTLCSGDDTPTRGSPSAEGVARRLYIRASNESWSGHCHF